MKYGKEYLDEWGVKTATEFGASEYDAIYDTLQDALTDCEEEVADEPIDFAIAICQEFISHAASLKEWLESRKRRAQ